MACRIYIGNFLGIVTVPKSSEFKPAAGENFRILWLAAGENYWKLLLNSTYNRYVICTYC